MLAWAFAVSQKTFHPELMERDDWEKVLNIRPLTDLPKKALGYDVPFITRWLEPSDYNDFWRMSNWQERSVRAQIPALIQSGWFDDNGMGTPKPWNWSMTSLGACARSFWDLAAQRQQ